MLHLTRLSGQRFALNPDLIERAEATPDTVVTLVNGSKYVIGESLNELISLVRAYRAEVVLASRTGRAAHGVPTNTADGAGAESDTRHARPTRPERATVTVLRAEQGES